MIFRVSDIEEFKVENGNFVCTTNFVKPVHIVLMAAIKDRYKSVCYFENENSQAYAENMRYDDPLDVDTFDGLNHSKAIRLRDQFDDDGQVKKVMAIFENNHYLNSETRDVLGIILAEIFQNFYAHAQSNYPPICCVQDWKTSNYIEISVADTGIGIEKSLEDILEGYKNVNPCRLACESGISCSLDKESGIGTKHSGYGLYFTKRFIEENGGIFHLFSGTDCYENIKGAENDHKIGLDWPGTGVRLIVNKSNFLNPEEFFRKITLEQEGEDYDEFF